MSAEKKTGLPVGYKSVRKLFKGTAEIAERTVRLWLYIDESVDLGLLHQAKARLRPLDEKLELSLEGYYDRPLRLAQTFFKGGEAPDGRTSKRPGDLGDELAVIIAADSPLSCELFWALSERRPTLVLSRRPAVFLRALESATGGQGPRYEKGLRCLVTLPLAVPTQAAVTAAVPSQAAVPTQAAAPEAPAGPDEGYYQGLFAELGRVAAGELREGAVAWARSLEFMRPAVAAALTSRYSLLNGALALVDFLPAVGLPLFLMNQMRMLMQMAAAYGLEMSTQRYIELAACLGSGLIFRTLSRGLTKRLPAVAWAVKASVAFGGTYALGRLARPYLEKAGQGLETNKLADLVQRAQQAIRQKLPAGQPASPPARQSASGGQAGEAGPR
ncbi:MAG: hypothetical protein FWF30_02005 [Coriobacteriia bacterium]|nr:hypothetical protein [Coriobacteriia bacterium]